MSLRTTSTRFLNSSRDDDGQPVPLLDNPFSVDFFPMPSQVSTVIYATILMALVLRDHAHDVESRLSSGTWRSALFLPTSRT